MATESSLKTPKGTRDWVGGDLRLRDHILQTVSTVLERHGGVPLDTPVFELRSILGEIRRRISSYLQPRGPRRRGLLPPL
ncbi:hypothetical protein VTK56DRAFT_4201 [Thermocarpiscus australiensis]